MASPSERMLPPGNERSSLTPPLMTIPSEVVIDTSHHPAASVASENNTADDEDETQVSSVLHTVASSHLERLFPHANQHTSFDESTWLFCLLNHHINLAPITMTKLTSLGWVTPQLIVNHFGLDNQTVAWSFATLGRHHVMPHEARAATTKLFMFACSQVLRFHIIPTPEQQLTPWQVMAKQKQFNDLFETSHQPTKARLAAFLRDPNPTIIAEQEMRTIRKTIRQWIRSGIVPHTKHPSSVASASSSQLHSLKKTVEQLHTNMDTQLASAVKSVKDVVATLPKTIEQQVEKQVTQMVQTSLNPQMKPRTIKNDLEAAMQRDCAKLAPQPVSELTHREEDINELLPPTNVKLHPNRRASFYIPKGRHRKSVSQPLKSPFDPAFEVGCNDDMLSVTSTQPGTLTSDQQKKKKATKEWMRTQTNDTKARLATLCTNNQPLKRSPLPASVTWNGKAGDSLERFLDRVEGHINQQPLMSYILMDEIARLWMKHGNAETVLLLGMQRKLHPALHCVSPSQFINDVVWLFGALQQAITSRGRKIIMEYKDTQDGICTWRKFVATYRHNGNVAVHLAEQQAIVATRFTLNYPGGMLSFLEDYENAFMNIDYVTRHTSMMGDGNPLVGLYTDQGKRQLFVQNFTLLDVTAEMIENVESTTETWDDMVDALRLRMAKRVATDKDVAKRRAHLTVQDTEPAPCLPTIPEQPSSEISIHEVAAFLCHASPEDTTVFANLLAQDMMVGRRLWQLLSSALKEQIMEARNKAQPVDSGGNFGSSGGPNASGKAQNQQSAPKQNTDIVKAPPKAAIPMQYSSKTAATTTEDEEEDTETFLSMLSKICVARTVPITVKAHTHYLTMIAALQTDGKSHVSIVDGGADSIVGGDAWLILSPTEGPLVKRANVIGFDRRDAQKLGLAIVIAVSKTTTQTGEERFLHADHLISNPTCPQTLMSSYELREAGLIVDDVSKRHMKSLTERGTSSIMAPNGDVIPLRTMGALPTFHLVKPTMEEWLNATEEKIINIACKDWNPQAHHEDNLKTMPPINNVFKSITEAPRMETSPSHEETPLLKDELTCAAPHDNQTKQDEVLAMMLQAIEDPDPFLAFMDCNEIEEEEPEVARDEFFDAIQSLDELRNFHLNLAHQLTFKGEHGPTPEFIKSKDVDAFLTDMDDNEIMGKNASFDTLAFAVQTVEKLQRLEAIQPRLAWKPLEVIKNTLKATTQWGKQVIHFPMRKHHVSRYRWDNRKRFREEVAMDTIFMSTPGFDGSTCGQVYLGLMSLMINFYPMPSKASGYILKTYQDFMRTEGVPEGLHRDLAPEEKVDKIIDLNREMMVKDTWAEAGHPNENPVEALGVKPLKLGAQALMNRTGAPNGAWPWAYEHIAEINNICATPALGWKTPISVRHGYTPDISAYL